MFLRLHLKCVVNITSAAMGLLGRNDEKQKVYFDDTVKWHGIMGVVVFMMKIFLLCLLSLTYLMFLWKL